MLADAVPEPRGSNRAVLVDDGTGFRFTWGVAEMIVQRDRRLRGAAAHVECGIRGLSRGP